MEQSVAVAGAAAIAGRDLPTQRPGFSFFALALSSKMPCELCLKTDNKAHSFVKICTLEDNTALFYTAPRLAEVQTDTPDNVQFYVDHFDETFPNPWIWIFDCKDMKANNFISNGVGRRVADLLQTEKYQTLKTIYIINPNMILRMFIKFISPFLKDATKARFKVLSLGPIEILSTLQGHGVNQENIQKVLRLVAKPGA